MSMNYTEAASINQPKKLMPTFAVPKEFNNGANLRWIRDPEGCIGYVHKASTPGILIHYPVEVLNKFVRVSVRNWSHESWKTMEVLSK